MRYTVLIFFYLVVVFSGGGLQSSEPGHPVGTPEAEPRFIDLSAVHGTYLGYGFGIHGGDLIYPRAFDELKPRFVRMEFGPRWDDLEEPIPSRASIDDLERYIERNYNGDSDNRLEGARYAWEFFKQRDIRIVKILFEIPYQWRSADAHSRLKTEHVEDLARFHTAHLRFLENAGIPPHMMELANEPDGHWNGHISPGDYNRLLLRCAELFEKHLENAPRILGPGLTFLDLHGRTPDYFAALDPAAVEALYGWSTHAWDEVEFPASRPEYGYGVWKPFLEQVNRLDPEREKPVFVTEYATNVLDFGAGGSYLSPRDRVANTAVDSWPYAVRVVANSITHLNRGANALILYRLSNAHWHETGWGFIQPETPETFHAKPVYHALREIVSGLPVGANVLQPTWYQHDDPVTMSVLREDDASLNLLLANHTGEWQEKRIVLPGSYRQEKGAHGLSRDGRFVPQLTLATTEASVPLLEIKLPPESIARARLVNSFDVVRQ